MKEEWKVEAER